jgi:hypothetical protein
MNSPTQAPEAPPGRFIGRSFAWHTTLFAAYCLVYGLVRVSFATSLTLGDATDLYLTQGFAWSYGIGNPPLHAWLFYALKSMLGPGLFTAQLLDSVLLVVTFAALLRTARTAGLSHAAAVAGSWSLFLVPPLIGSLSLHSDGVALACLSALTLEAAVLVTVHHRARDYIRLGVILAVGALTKYVYLVLPFGLGIVVAILARWRRRWVHAELVYALLPAMLLWPVLTGLLGRVEADLAMLVAERVAIRQIGIATTGASLLALGTSLLIYGGGLVLAVVACRPWRYGPLPMTDATVFASQVAVAGFGVIVGGMVVAGGTGIAPSDMHVVLLGLPLLAGAWVTARNGSVPLPYAALLVLAGLFALGRIGLEVSPACRGPCEERIPYGGLAEALGNVPAGATLVASDPVTAGNLTLRYPGARVVAATFPWEPDRPAGIAACFAILDPRLRPGTSIPDLLLFSDASLEPPRAVRVEGPGWEEGYVWEIARVPNTAACP